MSAFSDFIRRNEADIATLRSAGIAAPDPDVLRAVQRQVGGPLRPGHAELYRHELEAHERTRHGQGLYRDSYLTRLRELATPDRLAAIAAATTRQQHLDPEIAEDYLLAALDLVRVKRWRHATPGTFQRLRALGLPAWDEPQQQRHRCVAWGAVIRLPGLEDGPGDDFLRWCGYQWHADCRQRHEATHPLTFYPSDTTGAHLAVLGLDSRLPFTRKAVLDAYRERARRLHPDAGGDSAQFIRCKRARDALLMVCDP